MVGTSVPLEIQNNKELKRFEALENESNAAWLERAFQDGITREGSLILLGGNSMADFRVRVAQSHLRFDLTPSYWSIVAVLTEGNTLYSVPLDLAGDVSEIPHVNAVREFQLAEFDDAAKFPNIAVIQLTTTPEKVFKNIQAMKFQRGLIDLPALVLSWLSYVWCVGKQTNPLLDGQGLPSAVFVETLFGLAGVELTPGLATASTCPEAIWQAAKWWASFYEETSSLTTAVHAQVIAPRGRFFLRQPSAAIRRDQ